MQSSFLARKTLGQPNYILIAMAIAFVMALVPRGVRLAVESSANDAQQWLPLHCAERADLEWFRGQFPAAQPEAASTSLGSAERTKLTYVAALAVLVSFVVGYGCLRSFILSGIVVAVGVLSASLSLAILHYSGILEFAFFWMKAQVGVADAVLLAMPVVVYVASSYSAIQLLNNYRAARRDGVEDTAEKAIRAGWAPYLVATLAMVAGLGSLFLSDILPIQKFGIFTAVGLIGALVLLITLVPVVVHCFPTREQLTESKDAPHTSAWAQLLTGFAINRPAVTCLCAVVVLGASVLGIPRLGMSKQPLSLTGTGVDGVPDAGAAESQVTNSSSLEMVLTVPSQQIRTVDENAESDRRKFRMNSAERLALVHEIEDRLAMLPGISGLKSAASQLPEVAEPPRESDLDGNYHRRETTHTPGKGRSRRELWRISGRVAAEVDSDQFLEQLKQAVDPVLLAYQQRDRIVAKLHDAGKQLQGAQLCILYRTQGQESAPQFGTQEALLAHLLQRSGVAPKTMPDGKVVKGLSSFNLTLLDTQQDNPQFLESAITALSEQDALILVSASSDPTAMQMAAGGVTVIDVANLPAQEPGQALGAIYTGTVPLAARAQAQLPIALKQSLLWSALLITGVILLWLGSPIAGATAMVAICFPLVVIVGALGWLGVAVDLGLVVCGFATATVAIGGTIHFLAWFRRGLNTGLERRQAIHLAFDRCAPAMLQTMLIAGLALAMFAMSTLLPLQRVGSLMTPMLGIVMLGELFLLPALLGTSLGQQFGAPAAVELAESIEAEWMVEELPLAFEAEPFVDSPEEVVVELEPELLIHEEERVDVVPTPYTGISDEEKAEILAGPHGALHAKLRSLRRELPQDGVSL